MIQFQESNLIFRISSSWVIRKYDDHAFFRSLSGHGLKGVDFVALLPDGRLGLIEVKNYHPRLKADGKSTYPIKKKKADQLAVSLADKYHDTLRAIRIIKMYYHRKWYYRLRYYLLHPLERASNSDLFFWNEAARRAKSELPVSIILWLETPKSSKSYRSKIYAHLVNHIDPEKGQLLLGGNGFSPIPGIDATLHQPLST